MLFTAGLKGFLGVVYYAWFLVCIFKIVFFSPNINSLLRYLFVEGSNMLNHLIIPRNQPNFTCFSYIFFWIRLFLDHCLFILDWSPCPYNPYYYCFLYQHLIEIVFIHISWSDGAMWLSRSIQVWMERFWRHINNDTPSINTPPHL